MIQKFVTETKEQKRQDKFHSDVYSLRSFTKSLPCMGSGLDSALHVVEELI